MGLKIQIFKMKDFSTPLYIKCNHGKSVVGKILKIETEPFGPVKYLFFLEKQPVCLVHCKEIVKLLKY